MIAQKILICPKKSCGAFLVKSNLTFRRQKEQFSDGVGYSWIDTLKEYATNNVQGISNLHTNASYQMHYLIKEPKGSLMIHLRRKKLTGTVVFLKDISLKKRAWRVLFAGFLEKIGDALKILLGGRKRVL